MPISYHSHSGQYCSHAKGLLRDVVARAYELGFRSFGLSEHMPRLKDEELYPEEVEKGLTPAKLVEVFSNYVVEARQLQREYAGRLDLLVGMETENTGPHSLELAQRLIREHSLDYVVGSVHHVNGVPIDFSDDVFRRAEEVAGGTEAVFSTYFDLQYEMLQALRPAIVGHFDVVRIFRKDHPISAEVWAKITRNIDFAISCGVLFEANSSAYRKGFSAAYPQKDILKAIVEKGGRFTLCDDSHGPAQVGLFYRETKDYLLSNGVKELWFLARTTDGQGMGIPSVEPRLLSDWHTGAFWQAAP